MLFSPWGHSKHGERRLPPAWQNVPGVFRRCLAGSPALGLAGRACGDPVEPVGPRGDGAMQSTAEHLRHPPGSLQRPGSMDAQAGSAAGLKLPQTPGRSPDAATHTHCESRWCFLPGRPRGVPYVPCAQWKGRARGAVALQRREVARPTEPASLDINAVNWPSRSGGIASFRSHAEIRLRFVGTFARGGLHTPDGATNRNVKYAETLRYSMMAGACPRGGAV
jgi:hypothetical protein